MRAFESNGKARTYGRKKLKKAMEEK